MVSLKCPRCVRSEDFTKGRLGKSPSGGTRARVTVSTKEKEADGSSAMEPRPREQGASASEEGAEAQFQPRKALKLS